MSWKNHETAVLLLGAALLVGGCDPVDPFRTAKGAVADYQWTEGKFEIASDTKVAVAVVDRRSYILIGEKTPAFNGLVRTGFGVPYDSLTESGNSLADDFATSIVAGLRGAGIEAEAPELSSSLSLERSRDELMRADADRYVLLVLNEWRTDTYWDTVLSYSMELTIHGPGGAERLSKDFTGKDEGRGAGHRHKTRNAQIVAELYPAKLKEMFEDGEVAAALK